MLVNKMLPIVAIATAMVLVGAAPASSQQAVKVASEASFPPFSKTEADGSITGFEIDLGNEVCKRAGLECEWVKQDFDGMIAGLLAKKFDFIFSSMTITEERKEVVDFSLPYYTTPYRFIARKGAGIEITPEGLKGKTVGVYAGATQDKYVQAKYSGVLEPRGYQNMDQIGADLVAGRIDLAFNEQLAGAEFLKTPSGADFEFVGPEIMDREMFGMGVGAMFRKGDDALRQKVDEGLKAIYADGTFDRIAARYFADTSVRADMNW